MALTHNHGMLPTAGAWIATPPDGPVTTATGPSKVVQAARHARALSCQSEWFLQIVDVKAHEKCFRFGVLAHEIRVYASHALFN
mmetsp:Transcript_38040/g.104998  ORF Transcript_38040/g.104998 Transcript_38040/m.104998 type:complete len:84 (-) Transcript_38040:184-435(-)|eukprot:1919364-Prymnesium_polylepis.1